MKRFHLNLRKEKAQAMVEFALVFPVLLFLIYGIMEFGRMLYIYSSVVTASREAARYGAAAGDVSGKYHYEDCTGIRNAARRSAILVPITDDKIKVTYDYWPIGSENPISSHDTCPPPASFVKEAGTSRVTVEVEVTYSPLMPINFATFPVKAVSSRTILKGVEIEGTPAPGATTNPTVILVIDDEAHKSVSEDFSKDGAKIKVFAQLSGFTTYESRIPLNFSGSALSGLDYTPSAAEIVIPAGNTQGFIELTIIDDALYEGDETITISIGSPSPGTVVKGDPNTLNISITENDPMPEVSFVASLIPVVEGTGVDVTYVSIGVQLSNASALDVCVDFQLDAATTVQPPQDLTAFTVNPGICANGKIKIPAGQFGALIVMGVVQDALDEDDENVVLNLTAPEGATLGSPIQVVVTISDDDDPPEVYFDHSSTLIAVEGLNVKLQVRLTAASSKQISVAFDFGGSATSADYTFTPAGKSLTFLPGETGKEISVSLISDGVDEPDETVIAQLKSPVTNVTIGSPDSATIIIASSATPPTVSFEAAGPTPAPTEGDPPLMVKVKLSNLWYQPIRVPVSVANATAESADYVITVTQVTISPGEQYAVIPVKFVDDPYDEDEYETFELVLGQPDNGATLGNPNRYTIDLYDNDAMPVLNFYPIRQTAAEDAGYVTLRVVFSPADAPISERLVTFDFSVSPSTTATASDYGISIPFTQNIPPGQKYFEFTIEIKDNQIPDQGPRYLILHLDDADNATIGPDRQYILTINDDEVCPDFTGVTAVRNEKKITYLISHNLPNAKDVYITKIEVVWNETNSLEIITWRGVVVMATAISSSPATIPGALTSDWLLPAATTDNVLLFNWGSKLTNGKKYTTTITFSNQCVRRRDTTIP